MLPAPSSVTHRHRVLPFFQFCLPQSLAGRQSTGYSRGWKRGEKLGLLDLLAASTTMVNAFLSQVTLRSFSIVGCAMALVWACSPLGGQAALRIMTVGTTEITRSIHLDHMSANLSVVDWVRASLNDTFDFRLCERIRHHVETPAPFVRYMKF